MSFFLILIFELFALVFVFYLIAKICDRYFVESLEIITKKFKLSPDVSGATFMAVGSSAPELFISLIAISQVGSESIGVGTIVGSAIFNILMIVGASSIVAHVYLVPRQILRDLTFYLISVLLLIIVFHDGIITLLETLVFLGFYCVYIIVLIFWTKVFPYKSTATAIDKDSEKDNSEKDNSEISSNNLLQLFNNKFNQILDFSFPNLEKDPQRYLWTFVVSIFYIAILSYFLVEIAIIMAEQLHISAAIIALTILAAGTSIPDMIASVIVSRKGQGSMAVSNAVGSNTFDILVCLGLPWFIYILWKGENVQVSNDNLELSMLLLGGSVVLLLLILIFTKFNFGRKVGLFLIAVYVCYISYAVTQEVLHPSSEIEIKLES